MMTKIPLQTLRTLGVALFATLLTSCDKPELAVKDDDPVSPGKAPAPEAAVSKSSPDGNAPPGEAPGATPEFVRLEPAHPELEVFTEGDTIMIRGALKSRLQKKRIAEELLRDIPGSKVEDQLVVEVHRHPVGWGNRVSAAFLIPYFMEIEDPYVSYKEGVVTLRGKCKEQRQIKFYSELAVNTFAGTYLSDIRNELEVSGN